MVVGTKGGRFTTVIGGSGRREKGRATENPDTSDPAGERRHIERRGWTEGETDLVVRREREMKREKARGGSDVTSAEMSDVPRPSLSEIVEARERLRGVAWRTPLLPASRDESKNGDGDVYLKLECLQRTGSFKLRGAWNKMSRTDPQELKRGFVTVSAGNHGQAVAWCARKLGAACTVYVPEDAVQRKVDAIESMGARIVRRPHREIMESMTDDRMQQLGMTYVHPFGDRYVVAGQGTVGLEILEDLPDVRSVLVPVGGGGLVSGIALALRAKDSRTRVYGVQAEGADPLPRSLASGKAEVIGEPRTIADGIAASRVFQYMLPVLQENLSGAFAVSDSEIKTAMRHLMKECRVVVEPAGATALAAARRYRSELEEPIVCVTSGGNANPSLLVELLG